MWFETSFFGNPFAAHQYSRERKLLYAYDQAARLTALDATAFATRIADTKKAADDLSAAIGSTGAATGTQRGATLGTDSQLQAYRTEVSSAYGILLGRFKQDKSAPLLITVFGPSVQRYTRDLTKTNAQDRMDELDKLLAANAPAVGPDLVSAIGAAAAAYLGRRTSQLTDKATTAAAQLGESTQELVLDRTLWLNLGAIVAQYPTPEQERQRHAAADFGLLLRHPVGSTPLHETGHLLPQAILNLADSGLLPTTRLSLHNRGAGPLRFALSAALGTFPATGYHEVAPGTTLTLATADFGDPLLLPCLNVQNPSDKTGVYEVTVG